MSEAVRATFGAGCFWCVEAAYQQLAGVISAVPGYSGGTVANPTYEQVCTGQTGHAEVCQVTFDPDVISYEDLLDVFWFIHDPTQLNRQGNDIGTQYRSVIFYHDDHQRQLAERSRELLEASGVWPRPIVTQIVPFEVFYPAEPYHHDYFRRHPEQAYCQAVIRPKLEKFRERYAARLKKT